MKYLLLFLVLLTACTSYKPAATATPTDLESMTVALVHPDEDDGTPRSHCSGVWVDADHFVTAAHCIDEDQKVANYVVAGALKSPLPAAVLAVDEAHDVALLAAPGAPEHRSARLSFAPLVRGTVVHTMGHPMGLMYSYSTGVVSSDKFRDLRGARSIQTTASIGPGSSGGGLFTATGELVGLCRASSRRGQNLNYYTSVEYVGAILGRKLP